MIGAGLVARKARALGLTRKPWVKTSLAPGSQVVSAYLEAAELQEDLDAIASTSLGYGCTTCIGNSGPLQPEISKAISDNDLIATSVPVGQPQLRGGGFRLMCGANYLASPPLVVVYALAGDMNINVATDPIAQTPDGKDVYLKDIWPTSQEVADLVEANRDARGLPLEIRRCLQGRREVAGRGGSPAGDLRLGPRPRPISRNPP